MRRLDISAITAATVMFVGIATAAITTAAITTAASAQTVPVNPIAPGVGGGPSGLGGLSSNNVMIAPGASMPRGEIEQIGPGGIRLAPGGTGLGGSSLVTKPAEIMPPTR